MNVTKYLLHKVGTPSLEEQPTKTKEAPLPHSDTAGHQHSVSMSQIYFAINFLFTYIFISSFTHSFNCSTNNKNIWLQWKNRLFCDQKMTKSSYCAFQDLYDDTKISAVQQSFATFLL